MKNYFDLNAEREAKGKATLSFSNYIYLQQVLLNIFVCLFVFANLVVIVGLSRKILMQYAILSVVIVFIILFLLAPLVNTILLANLNSDISFWHATGWDECERTNLLKKIHHLPRIKSFETFIFFLFGSLGLFAACAKNVQPKPSLIVLLLFTSISTSYLGAVLSYHINEKTASDVAVRLTSQGIESFEIRTNKFFGLPLSVVFIFYIIIPVVLFAFTEMVLCYQLLNGGNHELFRLLFISLENIACVAGFTFLFFTKIRRYTVQMNKALTVLNKENITTVSEPFPVDFSTHISYTMYLVNRTIKMFQSLITSYSSINREIKGICSNLSSVSTQTQATVVEQTASIEEISATIKTNNELSRQITEKISEVINIANKTLSSTKENNLEIEKNLEQMQEITLENGKTIKGIQNLYQKIYSVQDIVNLIDSVVEQTKIIAFNAELETGEIYEDSNIDTTTMQNLNNVSTEIRNLANQTMELTKEIKDQISGIQHSSQDLIQTGNMCMEKIHEGNEISQSLNNKFRGIRFSASTTAEDAERIKNVLISQTESMERIAGTLTEMSSTAIDFTNYTNSISKAISILEENTQHIENLKAEQKVSTDRS